MSWSTTYVVVGDGEDPEECPNELDAIIRTGARLDGKVVRVERGEFYETRQMIWPEVGPEFTCPRREVRTARRRSPK